MLQPDDRFFAAAQEQYTVQQRVREKLDKINQVLFSQHNLNIPVLMQNRATPVYSWLLREKLEMAKSGLTDRPPMVIVRTFATTEKGNQRKDEVQSWLTGFWEWLESSHEILQPLTEDLLITSRSYIRILPNFNAWAGMPEPPEEAGDGEDLATYSRRVQKVEKEQYAHKCDNVPFTVELVPGDAVVPIMNGNRTVGVWEFRTVPVQEVLAKFVRPNSKGEMEPLARRLQAYVNQRQDTQTLTSAQTCTLITWADTQHIQIAVSGMVLTRTVSSDPRSQPYGFDEIILAEAHGLDRLPYAVYTGRTTRTDDPVKRWFGFLDPVESLVRRYDEVRTQLHSSARLVAWPGQVETVPETSLAEGDKAEDIEMEEAGWIQLPPGHDVRPAQLTNGQDFQVLIEDMRQLKHDIDMKTFSEATYGDSNATSGYQQNLVSAQGEKILQTWKRGLRSGHQDACQLALACARVLVQKIGPVPLRTVAEEERQYVTLTADHLSQTWDVRCEVENRPIGGEAGLAQTLANEVNNGWISRLTAMERLGVRNPQREIQRILQEQVLASPDIAGLLRQAVIARAMPLLQSQQPTPPTQPLIPQALAGQTSSPELLARLPAEQGAMPPIGGLPSPGTGNIAPPPPGPGTGFGMNRPDTNGVGGPGFGNGQALPGGLSRQM